MSDLRSRSRPPRPLTERGTFTTTRYVRVHNTVMIIPDILQHRVQPVEDQKVLPTEHVAAVAPVQVKEHKEEMNPEHQAKLHAMRTEHQDTQVVGETERSAAHLGQFEQEHTHHHIHETGECILFP